MLSNWNNSVLYIGVTSNLSKRIFEHKHKITRGFTEKYNVNKLVYFEQTSHVYSALEREKQLKNWKREWKDALIETINPHWEDLSDQIA